MILIASSMLVGSTSEQLCFRCFQVNASPQHSLKTGFNNCREGLMAPELLYSLLASTTMLGCWLGFRVGVVLGSAGGAAGDFSHCKLLIRASGLTHSGFF